MDDGKQTNELAVAGATTGILSNLLSVFFPVRCVHCGVPGDWLCPGCAAGLIRIGPHKCLRCGSPADDDVSECRECRGRELHFNSAGATFVFEGPARSLVHRLKYSGHRSLAGLMAELSCNTADLTAMDKGVTLTYVPQHRSKLLNRGYNQAGMYARALARRLDLPLQDLLCKIHPTPSQNRLNIGERRMNLVGSMTVRRKKECFSRRVILVDDVYTTGSTAAECSEVLKRELGVEVYVWTFARTVKAGV